ncbi:MAG: T9SS type A sorting domain-containing protein [Flavobacteriales bacterium]|nr:T9SS type A sorting domain-containing protein [Flavobacteriales bacterium]
MRFSFIILIQFIPVWVIAQCNGHPELCGKRYDQVAYLTTHNSFNAGDDGFNLPNQTHGVAQQLNDGVRALMLDVYDEGGVATEYHGFSFLGTEPLATSLTEIKDFLDANPNEIVTILFETYITSDLMDTVITQVGLKPMLYVQSLGEPWPTLQEMIDSGKRLVIFSDHNNGQPGQDWYLYMWDFAVETNFANNALSDFSCDFNRGDSINDLFILNHFATDPTLGTGRADLAAQANEFNYFYPRALQCWNETGKFSNFPTVDFYELGNTLEVVDSLNGVTSSVGISERSDPTEFSLFPNPTNGLLTLNGPRSFRGTVTVYTSLGQAVLRQSFQNSKQTIDITGFESGVYHVTLVSDQDIQTFRVVKR